MCSFEDESNTEMIQRKNSRVTMIVCLTCFKLGRSDNRIKPEYAENVIRINKLSY